MSFRHQRWRLFVRIFVSVDREKSMIRSQGVGVQIGGTCV